MCFSGPDQIWAYDIILSLSYLISLADKLSVHVQRTSWALEAQLPALRLASAILFLKAFQLSSVKSFTATTSVVSDE